MANKSVAEGKLLVDLGGGVFAEQFALGTPGIGSTSVVIADSASLSAEGVIPDGMTLVGVIARAGWGTAGISFQVSLTSGGTFYVLLDPAGAEYTIPGVVAARYVPVEPSLFLGVKYLKVQSGTSAVGTTQAGGDTLDLVYRQVL